ncbi:MULTISPECIES: hypothetical protein [Roseomonadaceae]|uniref:J domain-containing protein n=1 Tax=Falsiroseomonas oleicola TaxID=2801474 RepID=A0ABS6H8J9_9PROT|nr:hypothetical protein [Roseomonas oleicola]MBU8545014.1 hypothetical protein [Roseomonas oleicola]
MGYLAAGILLALMAWGLGRLVARLLHALTRRRPLGRWRALRLARSKALVRSEQARAEALAAEVARLRLELRNARQAPASEERFRRAKREFARRFHPDLLPRRSPERPLRIAIFREYWAVLRRIEREG